MFCYQETYCIFYLFLFAFRPVLHNTTALHVAVSNGYFILVYLLLEYGADFEAKDFYGRTPLSCALEYERNYLQKVTEILVMQRAKKQYLQGKFNVDDLENIHSRKWLKEFFTRCNSELEMMKEDYMCKSVTVGEILNKNLEQLTMLFRNESVVKSLSLKDFESKYPIYCDMFRIHVDLALERRKFLDLTKYLLNNIFENTIEQLGYESLPDVILEKISSYFCLREMKDWIKI